jgi:Flp pilus assembly protein TadG
MSCKCEEEFNPWPSFVDIFSSVILTLLLFLLVLLANLGYFAQFKYKVSYTGSVSNGDIITDNNKDAGGNSSNDTKSASSASNPNSTLNIQIINEQKQMILTLQNQIASTEHIKSAKGSDDIESAGINVADKKENSTEIQKIITAVDEYLVVTYKDDELFIDDVNSKKIKDFLNSAKTKYPEHKIIIYSSEIQGQLSATISKQISLARTMSMRNLIKKFNYEKKDIKVDLANKPEIKETIDTKSGYLVIKIIK